MVQMILIGLGAALCVLLLGCIIGTFICVKKIQKLYDDLENINPENWEEKEKEEQELNYVRRQRIKQRNEPRDW